MSTNSTMDWIHQSALPRIRSVLPPTLAGLLNPRFGGGGSSSNGSTPMVSDNTPGHTTAAVLLNPPSNLESLRSRFLLFLGCSALLISFVWFSICMSLYPLGQEYQVMNYLYESRWSLFTIFLTGISTLLLAYYKSEAFYVICGLSTVYNCGTSMIVIIVYSWNFYKARYGIFPTPILIRTSGPRQKYLQLCACMIVVALMSSIFGLLILAKLKRISRMYYAPIVLEKSQKVFLFKSALIQIPFVWFSIYAASHVIHLQFAYVQQYMIQELFCALTLQTLLIIQISNCFNTHTDRLNLKLLLFLNLCQAVQEIFYAWNSYYIFLYIHTTKMRLAHGAWMDMILMGVNFGGHLIRVYTAACTVYRLSSWLDVPLLRTKIEHFELSSNVKKLLLFLSLSSFLLATIHLTMDVYYTLMSHIYRTLIAFTGISVFYLILIGSTLIAFLRTNRLILLIVTFVLMLLLLAVSSHGLYIYLEMTFHNVLLNHLDTLGKEKFAPSVMHFAEGCLSLCAFCVCVFGGISILRLLHIENWHRHDRRDGRLRRPLQILFLSGIVQLVLTIVNTVILMSIKDENRVFQAMLAYSVLDTLSTLIMCIAQIVATRPSNTRLQYALMILILFLICETLTTFNYLSTKTSFVQLLIVFTRLLSPARIASSSSGSGGGKSLLKSLFPSEEVSLMIGSHGIQLAQWFLTVFSLCMAGYALEILYDEQQRELISAMPVSTTEASRSTSVVSMSSSNTITNQPQQQATGESSSTFGETSSSGFESRGDNSSVDIENPSYRKRAAAGQKKTAMDAAVALLESNQKSAEQAIGAGRLKESTNTQRSNDDEELHHRDTSKLTKSNGNLC